MKIYALIVSTIVFISVHIPSLAGVYEPDKLQVHLRMDKKFFYSDEAVYLQVCIKNISERKNYFEVYDFNDYASSLYTTFQPMVYDMNGREAEIIVPYKMENKNVSDFIRGLDKRLVELAPGEIFIHTVNLKELYDLHLNTAYRVQGLFYPSFDEQNFLKSNNELTFKIIEAKQYNKPSQVDAVARTISPKEVILLTLKAEKDREWNNWLKYVNIEKFINAFPEFVQKYNHANFEEKSQIEKEFIRFVTRERDDYLVDYKILRESVEKDKKIAYVDVVVDRYGIRVPYRYKCRYKLEQYKNLWLITDEVATVMKGVAR
jgi:hypothetical protein